MLLGPLRVRAGRQRLLSSATSLAAAGHPTAATAFIAASLATKVWQLHSRLDCVLSLE